MSKKAPSTAWSGLARATVFAGFAAISAFAAVSTSASPAFAACNGGIQCERQFETGYPKVQSSTEAQEVPATPQQMQASTSPRIFYQAVPSAPATRSCTSIQCERQFETGYGTAR